MLVILLNVLDKNMIRMVRWNPTEMVVVEMTSKNPSYRLTEGGIFSFG